MYNDVVRFIYKDGRVIPIRKHVKDIHHRLKAKENRRETYKGIGLATGGVAAMAAGGEASARLVKKSAQLKAQAKRGFKFYRSRQLSIFSELPKPAPEARALYRKQALMSKKLFKLRNPILGIGTVLGASLVASGVKKIVSGTTGKDYELLKETGSDIFSAGVSTAVGLYYYKRLGVKGLKNLIKQAAARRKNIPRPYHQPIKHKQGTLVFK